MSIVGVERPAVGRGRVVTCQAGADLERAALDKIYLLRRVLNRVRPVDAMELLIDRMEQTPDNQQFLEMLAKPRDDDTPFDHSS